MDHVDAFQRRFRATMAARPEVAAALTTARRVVSGLAEGGTVRFRGPRELDAALARVGFALAANEPFGPPHDDARQLIYRSPDRMVIVKVKTMGYPDGTHRTGSLSIEITNGTSVAWKDVLCKVDAAGQPIPSNLITPDALIRTPQGLRVRRATGQVEEIMDHEAIADSGLLPADADRFADRAHFALPKDFDPSGAADLIPE